NYPNRVHPLYRGRLPAGCELLLGPDYALLRPEFAALRPGSLARRRERLSRLLVFMGGSDPLNETGKALDGIGRARFAELHVDVVIGAGNPHRAAIAAACRRLPSAELTVQTPRMAEL